MTCIAAAVYGNTMAMAGDRGATFGSTIRRLSSPKVAQKGAYLVGYYGSMEGERLLRLFDFPAPPDDVSTLDIFMHSTVLKGLQKFYSKQEFDTKDQENGLGLLIAVRGFIYEHDICDGSMTRYTDTFAAVGSGSQLALGSLDSSDTTNPEEAVGLAVSVACKFNIYCLGPADVITLQVP